MAETIPDPDAKKPDDWDDEMDGEWEPPMVTNPDYKVGLHGRLYSWPQGLGVNILHLAKCALAILTNLSIYLNT